MPLPSYISSHSDLRAELISAGAIKPHGELTRATIPDGVPTLRLDALGRAVAERRIKAVSDGVYRGDQQVIELFGILDRAGVRTRDVIVDRTGGRT